MSDLGELLETICRPYGWQFAVRQEMTGTPPVVFIYVTSVDDKQYLLYQEEYSPVFSPWRARAIAMTVLLFLIENGIVINHRLNASKIDHVRTETFAPPPKASIQPTTALDPLAQFELTEDPSAHLGAVKIDHAPQVNAPMAYVRAEDGTPLEVRSDASPRRVLNGKLQW